MPFVIFQVRCLEASNTIETHKLWQLSACCFRVLANPVFIDEDSTAALEKVWRIIPVQEYSNHTCRD